MYRVRRKGKGWRNRWPFSRWLPYRLDERFCRECTLPYQNGPLPEPVIQFHRGNVAAVLLPKAGWKEKYSIRLGRWKPAAGRYFLSEFIPTDELEDLEMVVAQLREYLHPSDDESERGLAVRQKEMRSNVGRMNQSRGKMPSHK